jgi:glucose/arabinose dehydrogenase
MFPSKYKNGAFVARHGSWNKSNKLGGDVIFVTFNKDGTVKSMEPFITGFLVDDWNGAIYRITYGKAKVAGR